MTAAMKTEDRKTAVAAYKERKTAAGIFAITCTTTGQRWVGSAPDLATIQNRIWFTLRHGSHRSRSLQAAWTAHGADSLTFEAVERLDDETLDYVRERILKERRADWCQRLWAEGL